MPSIVRPLSISREFNLCFYLFGTVTVVATELSAEITSDEVIKFLFKSCYVFSD
jgi:hypothetical protein